MLTPSATGPAESAWGSDRLGVLSCSAMEEDGATGTCALSAGSLSALSRQFHRTCMRLLCAQSWASYISTANDAVPAIQSGLQAGLLARAAGHTALANQLSWVQLLLYDRSRTIT